MDRRKVLQVLSAAPAAVAFTWTPLEAQAAADHAHAAVQASAASGPYQPRFFTAAEFATIRLLADLIIPRDAKSGSASDAGAPEFIDYIVAEQPERKTAMHGGLVWLDTESRRRFDKGFMAAAPAERAQILDDIAYPAKAPKAFSHGVRFFTTLRDLVATGFWSSKVGMADIGYMGNVFVAEWKGAPDDVLKKLGVSYE
jgi:hypothetical protein